MWTDWKSCTFLSLAKALTLFLLWLHKRLRDGQIQAHADSLKGLNIIPGLSMSSIFLASSGRVREKQSWTCWGPSTSDLVVMTTAHRPSSPSYFIPLKLTPLPFKICDSILTVNGFQFTNKGLGGQFKKLHKGIERTYLFFFNLIHTFRGKVWKGIFLALLSKGLFVCF